MATVAITERSTFMALATTHFHRPTEHRFPVRMAVALAVFVAAVAFIVFLAADNSTTSIDQTPSSPVIQPTSEGPNADRAPIAGVERSPADGARADIANRGPNADLPPDLGSSSNGQQNLGPNQGLSPVLTN